MTRWPVSAARTAILAVSSSRISPMTSGLGEVKTARFVDLRLHDAGHDLLGRVLDRDNVAAALFGEVAEAGINRGRLAAASRAGQQQQPGGLAQEALQFHADLRGETQFSQGPDASGVKEAQD